MKIVIHEESYKVVDSLNRKVILSKPLNTLDDIFNSYWVTSTKEVIPDSECEDIIYGYIKSFKHLKHEVAAYLIKNDVWAFVPHNYIRAYNANKHLYVDKYNKELK